MDKPAQVVYMVVGEASGDVHAALVAQHLLAGGSVRLRGAAGPLMRAAGVAADFRSEEWGTVGIVQSLRRTPVLYAQLRRMAWQILRDPPDVLMLVDFGAFNVRLARLVRRGRPNLPIFYYFPPGSWSPRPRPSHRLAPLVDCIATPFAHSAQALRAAGLPAYWVGHPILDRLRPPADRAAFRREAGLPEGEPVFGLLPGSRGIERACLSAHLLGAARLLRERYPAAACLWSVMPGRARTRWDREAEGTPGVTLVDDSARLLRGADLVLTAMGTATLEATVAGCLIVSAYRVTRLMAQQAYLLGLGTDLYALPNILLGRALVPEVLQYEATAANLAAEAVGLWEDPDRAGAMRAGLAEVRAILGTAGASARTADLVRHLLSGAGLPPFPPPEQQYAGETTRS